MEEQDIEEDRDLIVGNYQIQYGITDLLRELEFKIIKEYERNFWDKILFRKGLEKIYYVKSGLSMDEYGVWYNNDKKLGVLFNQKIKKKTNVVSFINQTIRENKLAQILKQKENEDKNRFCK